MPEEEFAVKKLECFVWSYLIQDKCGRTIEDILYSRNDAFSQKTVFQIGIQVLDSLKLAHNAGFLYNDLKLNNIVVGDATDYRDHQKSLHKIRLIDFGLAYKY